ncbi:MAG: hypothetical protein P8Y20_02225 [Gammaproteobacteria bacterium]
MTNVSPQKPTELPCHQSSHQSSQQSSHQESLNSSVERQTETCPESGFDKCDCCDMSVPAAVRIEQVSSEKLLFVIRTYQQRFTNNYISQPFSPPFRPPRVSV